MNQTIVVRLNSKTQGVDTTELVVHLEIESRTIEALLAYGHPQDYLDEICFRAVCADIRKVMILAHEHASGVVKAEADETGEPINLHNIAKSVQRVTEDFRGEFKPLYAKLTQSAQNEKAVATLSDNPISVQETLLEEMQASLAQQIDRESTNAL